MPLPVNTETSDWPPRPWQPLQHDLDEAAVWYGGDPHQLAAFYVNRNQLRPSERRFSWGRQKVADVAKPTQLHIPAASDVAATSADLLFGEEAKLTIPDAHEENAGSEAMDAEDRLQELAEYNALSAQLLEGAEVCAGVGGIYLRPVWDQEFVDFPILDIVHGDQAIPEFRWGRLTAVTFWRVVQVTGSTYVRLLERHEDGIILNGLYVGTRDKLGAKVPLASLAEFNEPVLDDQINLPAGIDGLVCRYVPNVLPNRRHRGWPVGRADTAGAETLMDALDETWTSWMRDIRLGKMRIVADREAFTNGSPALGTGEQRGGGAWLDTDREVFTLLDMGPTSVSSGGHPITPIEFKLRVQEHADTALALFERIVTTAGYSAQTFGLHGDGSEATATEVRAREGKSLRTKSRKQRYWEQAVADVAFNLLVIDREVFGSDIVPIRPRLNFSDSLINDPQTTATTVELLARAQAASTETLVRMVNPDLDEAEVQAEVQRIRDENGLSVPDPTGRSPFGPFPPVGGVGDPSAVPPAVADAGVSA